MCFQRRNREAQSSEIGTRFNGDRLNPESSFEDAGMEDGDRIHTNVVHAKFVDARELESSDHSCIPIGALLLRREEYHYKFRILYI